MNALRLAACVLLPLSIGCSSSETPSAAASNGSPTDASPTTDAASSGNPGAPTDASAPVDATVSSDAGAPVDAASFIPDGESPEAAAIVAARPYKIHVPDSYDAGAATPLVVMFHGYGASGAEEELYMDIAATSDTAGFLYAYGDGTIDDAGNRFWNATDGCCNFNGSPVDDVAYFNAIVDDVTARYNVDPKRVFVLGHSNGAFMAHRLACDVAPRVAGIVSLAGAVWEDPSKCNPANPVAILDVHGNADQTIGYDGGVAAGPYPSEQATMATWSQKNGCTGQLTPDALTLDIDSQLPGNETITASVGGCPSGIDVELWTIQGGSHIPSITLSWGGLVWGFMSAHPKP